MTEVGRSILGSRLSYFSVFVMSSLYVEVIAEQLPVLCSLNLGCWARLCTVCSMVRNVDIPMVKAIRVDRIHANLAARVETSWLYEPPLDEQDEEFHRYYETERELLISVVHVPKAYPEGVASKHLAVPVQCTFDGNTCWYRLVASSLGERRCEVCSSRAPGPYAFLLQTVYAYGDVFLGEETPQDLPHVFCMLSPCCEAIDCDFMQFESMVAAECWSISDGAVFHRLGMAIESPVANLFPLRMHESYPAYAVGDLSSCENVGLTTTDMEHIEEQTCFVFEQTPHGIIIHWAHST